MNALLRPVLSTVIAGVVACWCYVLLYRSDVLVIQRPLFFRIGMGALVAATIGTGAVVLRWAPTHLIHAIFAVSVAAAVHAIQDGLHPDTEAWFYSLFRA